jgi:hypothetical protein
MDALIDAVIFAVSMMIAGGVVTGVFMFILFIVGMLDD